MRRLAVVIVLTAAAMAMGSGAALAKGEPQGPDVQDWFCILDLGTWHCVPQGVLANFGAPSGPSVNWECDDPGAALCGVANFGTVSFGPPAGTHFVGTENLIREDVYAGQPCTQGSSGFVDLGVAVYFFCHHYAS
jgi:hypothetical protein